MVSLKKRQMLVNIVRLIINVIYIICDFSDSVSYSNTFVIHILLTSSTIKLQKSLYLVILHATEYRIGHVDVRSSTVVTM